MIPTTRNVLMKLPSARNVSRILITVALVWGLWQLSGLVWSVFSEALEIRRSGPTQFPEFFRFFDDLLGILFQCLASTCLTVEILRHMDDGYDEERVRDCLDACGSHDTQRVRAALLACEGMSTERLRTRPRPLFEGDMHAVASESIGLSPKATQADAADIALGLDIHAWLVHRASLVLGARMTIDWALLYSQFGEGFASDERGQHHFKVAFLRHLVTLTEDMPELYYEESQSGLVFGPIPSKPGEPV